MKRPIAAIVCTAVFTTAAAAQDALAGLSFTSDDVLHGLLPILPKMKKL